MSRKKRKIEIASPDEVERYASEKAGPASENAGTERKTGPEPSPADRAAEPPGDQPQVDELATLRTEVEGLRDKHLRAVAEHQNYVRRAATERSEAVRYASAELARGLLTVVDDFERTLAAVSQDDSSSVVEGVRLVHGNLVKTLETHHVERIAAVGETFDPACHEAVMQRPSAEHPPGTVLEEYQAGYRLWDRVLRPSKVVVSTAPAESADDTASAGGNPAACETESD